MFLLDANSPQTGKSLLAQAIAVVMTVDLAPRVQ